ncbi:DinB family protein [Chitinophaga pinensis]|uniref:Damage-inducible protein DinB n=1 Tax=Chitinophaga pinensis TaxID=79329 RepID=A0A5C6LLM4_9BACT|nr:DinB family protein [Chitinophaga pinensis]TWV94358.1 damage-inducible protein DinB [Chitinophaga pinensis]
MTQQLISKPSAITPAELLEHWQGHRRLTRKVIETFPEKDLFSFSVGGMRPFSELALEMISMGGPGIDGVLTGKWSTDFSTYENGRGPKTKAELLTLWDELTEKLNRLWPQIPAARFHEIDLAFGQWEGPIHFILFYWIDNEIHHRAQGYVYLRALGIEPPAFWDRQ